MRSATFGHVNQPDLAQRPLARGLSLVAVASANMAPKSASSSWGSTTQPPSPISSRLPPTVEPILGTPAAPASR